MKVVVYTLGCKVSKYESDAVMQELLNKGFEVCDKLVFADIYIINTCAVTNEAEKKSRMIIAKINKINKNAKIIVCGCASEHSAEQFLNKENVTCVLGTYGKNKIASILENVGNLKQEITTEYEEFNEIGSSRTRAYLKIQDGCNNFCSYCLIPFVRGRSRSRTLENIVSEAKHICKTNKEIVITGINISDYRINNQLGLSDLMVELGKIDARIRLGSLEVNIITEEFLKVLKDMPNFCEQFHLSMQSGCNKILKLMNRHYTKEEFLSKIALIKKYFPDASITTDVIVGFPTETEQDFLETYETCKKANFFQMHIFPYSIRKGTKAEKMQQVDSLITKTRLKKLHQLNDVMHKEFCESKIGKTYEIITEQFEDDFVIGHTGNYIKIYLNKVMPLDKLVKVKLLEIHEDGMLATAI